MNIKLIGNKTSPFVRKVEIVLQELGLSYDFLLDSPWEPNSQVVKLNPIGKIPVIVINEEIALFDSSVITDFLLEKIPSDSLRGLEGINEKLFMRVVHDTLDTAVLCSWELKRAEGKIDSGVLEKYKKRISTCLQYIDGFYSVEKAQFSISDIAMVCCIDYLLLRQFFYIVEDDYPNLFNRRKNLYERKSVKITSPISLDFK